MGKTSSRFETISKIVLIVISLFFGIFLISFGDKILDDVTKIFKPPKQTDFYPSDSLGAVEIQLKEIENIIQNRKENLERINAGLQSAQNSYQSEQESFEAWIKTRKAVGSPKHDKKVLARTKELDKVRHIRDQWNSSYTSLKDSLREIEIKKDGLLDSKRMLIDNSNTAFQASYKGYSLKIFLIRLLIAVPILALGIFLILKYRKSKYNSFIWGYSLFSLYIFFIGLLPYFPSYGGYIRYSVGIILTFTLGYYVIKQLAAHRERIKSELNKSTEERAKNIEYERAIKGFELHSCPSCERSFQIIEDKINKKTNFCTHCGLLLFEDCPKCGQRNFSHFSYCSGCGENISDNES